VGFGAITALASGNALTSKSAEDSKRTALNSKIDKSAQDFESLLLSSWLQGAYQSFGTAPGSEDGEDLDSGKEQYQSFAMQQLGTTMTNSGGIGIAKMISEHLHKAADGEAAAAAEPAAPPPNRAISVPPRTEIVAKD
jgi:Rod binding domain-containing protein